MHKPRVEWHHVSGTQQQFHLLTVSLLKLKSSNLAIMNFTIAKNKEISILVRMNNMKGDTKIQELLSINK